MYHKIRMTKFLVNIEQPLCSTFEVEAESAEQAEEIAREKYRNAEFVLGGDDYGTEAVFQVLDEKGEALTAWS